MVTLFYANLWLTQIFSYPIGMSNNEWLRMALFGIGYHTIWSHHKRQLTTKTMAPQPGTYNKDHSRDVIVLLYKGQITERNIAFKYDLLSQVVRKAIVTLGNTNNIYQTRISSPSKNILITTKSSAGPWTMPGLWCPIYPTPVMIPEKLYLSKLPTNLHLSINCKTHTEIQEGLFAVPFTRCVSTQRSRHIRELGLNSRARFY